MDGKNIIREVRVQGGCGSPFTNSRAQQAIGTNDMAAGVIPFSDGNGKLNSDTNFFYENNNNRMFVDSVRINQVEFQGVDGTAGQVLTTDGFGNATFQSNGNGDVTGPGSSTDNALARFDGTTGKTIQNSGVIIDDSNNISTGS